MFGWVTKFWLRLIQVINKFFADKSLKTAIKKARQRNEETGVKMFVILFKGEYYPVSKKEFKKMWHNIPAMKKKTIQEWENNLIVLN